MTCVYVCGKIPHFRNAGLFQHLREQDGDVRLLSRDGGYLSVESEHLIFRDFLLYQPFKISLAKLLAQNQNLFEVGELSEKLIFPYKILNHYDHLLAPWTLVNYEHFENDLEGGRNSLNEEFDTYQQLMVEYGNDSTRVLKEMKLKEVPKTGQTKFTDLQFDWLLKEFVTVEDILLEYEEADVVPLMKVVEHEIDMFAKNAHIDLLQFTTASSISYSLGIYASERSGSPKRLHNPVLAARRVLKQGLIGGFSCIFTRICGLNGKIRPFESVHQLGRPHERIKHMFIMDVSGKKKMLILF